MPLRRMPVFLFPSPKTAEGNEGNGGGSNTLITSIPPLVTGSIDVTRRVDLSPRVVVDVRRVKPDVTIPPVTPHVEHLRWRPTASRGAP